MTRDNTSRTTPVLLCAFLLPALLIFTSCATAPDTVAEGAPATVRQVDLERYSGKWYEIARYPNWFQKGCVCSTAEYTVMGPEKVRVENKCLKEDGTVESISGMATPANPGNSRLNVRFDTFVSKLFPGLTTGKYWILHLDEDYGNVVVGDPGRDYLWILSRSPTIDQRTYERLANIAAEKGFDPARLRENDCARYGARL
jgi:apolipoprotein D and lipocalin family protein